MTAGDFRRLALGLEGAEEGSHFGAVDFRVGGRIFATLAAVKQGYGNLMLTPEIQADFVAEQPDLFLPIRGGWGRNGATHVRLADVSEDVLAGSSSRHHRITSNLSTPGRSPAAGWKPDPTLLRVFNLSFWASVPGASQLFHSFYSTGLRTRHKARVGRASEFSCGWRIRHDSAIELWLLVNLTRALRRVRRPGGLRHRNARRRNAGERFPRKPTALSYSPRSLSQHIDRALGHLVVHF